MMHNYHAYVLCMEKVPKTNRWKYRLASAATGRRFTFDKLTDVVAFLVAGEDGK